MGCESMFYTVLVTISAALITYNILLSSTRNVRSDFPREGFSSFELVDDPVIQMPRGALGRKERRLFHTAVTASQGVYNAWQCRIMYYWFKKQRESPGGSEMGGFTRILHSGKPDSLMDEIPTFVAQPLPEGVDRGFIVLNRPYAFVQWLEQADIKEDYILMAEPDHVIVNPIPNLAKGNLAAAFPFFYIEPKKFENIVSRYYPAEKGPITNVDPIGNSPVLISKKTLKRMAPTWMNVSLSMKKDPEADKAFGWVLEMYGYAVASALHNVTYILRKDFMLQPPWDHKLGNSYIIHYTYGCDYNMQGQLTYGKIGEWRFDKRSFTGAPMPRNLSLPPKGVPETVVTLVKMVNEATANIPNWDDLKNER